MSDFQITFPPPPTRTNFTVDNSFRRVLLAIHERFPEPDLSLRGLSRDADVSERHLARLFKRHLGKTFHQYLREIRVHKAAALLAHSTDEIKTISGLVGYIYPSYFGRDFRLLMSCTPGQFRVTQCSRANAMPDL